MNENLKRLIARFHQIEACDANAIQVYSTLAAEVEDPALASELREMVSDEERHVTMIKTLIKQVQSFADTQAIADER